MDDPLFQIYIDRLREDKVEKIAGPFTSSFLEIDEPQLQFPYPIDVKGEAYLSEDHLVIHLNISTKAKMPCSVCNEMTETELKVDNFYHAEPLEEIKGAVFNFKEPLREALLLELPHYLECKGGNCPERPSITPFLRTQINPKEDTYFPFSDL